MLYAYLILLKPHFPNVNLPVTAGLSVICMGMVDAVAGAIWPLHHTVMARAGDCLTGA